MSDLTKLTEKMLKRIENESEEKTAKAKIQAKELLSSGERQLMDQSHSEKAKIDATILKDYNLNLNSYKIKLRNRLLAEKQQIIEETFEQALKKMKDWNSTEFQDFLEHAIKQFSTEKKIEVILGNKSSGYISQEFLHELEIKSSFSIVLSQEKIANKSGFILRMAGIDYNFCFEDIIKTKKEDLMPMVSTKLFN